MKKYLLVAMVLVLVSVVVISCAGVRTPVPDDLKEVVITLERTPCFGFCPVYMLTIYGSGEVIYEGKRFVGIEGIRTTTISAEKIEQLVSEFQNIAYFSLNDSYEETNATDMPSAITSITINGETKIIRHYHGDSSAPKELTELENKIDEIVYSDQWVKRNPQ